MRWRLLCGILTLTLTMVVPVQGDEGMWLFSNPPKQYLKDKFKFEAPPQWYEHLQKSSVRFNAGGSGSFVSANGLVMTNHHVGTDALQKISTKDKDYIKTGFHAHTQSEEVKCIGTELNVLIDITDVTKDVQAAVKEGMSADEANKARRAVINTLEKDSFEKTKLRSDVVTLYQGGQYHLYRYKKYTDVRLVFAPEKDIAFFGGDPDNFEFPRFDLDICFFRVYENDKPAKIEHFLKWNEGGCKEGDLIFVSGHPGKTDRLNTLDHLTFHRDRDMPLRLDVIRRREVVLKTYADRSAEHLRQAQDELFTYQNSRKARLGMLGGLQDPALFAMKKAEEDQIRKNLADNPAMLKSYDEGKQQVADALKKWNEIHLQQYLLDRGVAFNCEQYQVARTLVRYAEETQKPDPQRLREFNSAGLESLKEDLESPTPVYDEMEIVKFTDSLSMTLSLLGVEHPVVVKLLNGKSPQARAVELIRGSKLSNAEVRKKLLAGSPKAIQESDDPMIKLAASLDKEARALRTEFETKVEEPMRQGYAKIAKARFAALGDSIYPDATFTLRLAFGVVKGYEENGKKIPWFTTIGGTFDHAESHGNREPFNLPQSWTKARGNLKKDVPFNFVSTADIIGGNSGSPVVNRAGELVGIIFDGNIQSLVLDYYYTDEQARATSVHSAGILESLKSVYSAKELVQELTGK